MKKNIKNVLICFKQLWTIVRIKSNIMITPEELIQDLINFYGYEVDLSYAINYIDMVGQYAEVDSFHLWLQELT